MPTFVQAEVGGIQNFISGTGKLKEMIGGSEIICHVCENSFYGGILGEIGCDRGIFGPDEGSGWHLLCQDNAGTLSMILPGEKEARAFLAACSRKALERFPGLPLYGAQAEMDGWSVEAWDAARRRVGETIGEQRVSREAADGLPMLPPLAAARLDGLPAVADDGRDGKRELVSLPSICRRDPEMVRASRERLQRLVRLPEIAGVETELVRPPKIEWAEDLEVMLDKDAAHAEEGGKVALIHMDGNDLGKLFGSWLAAGANRDLARRISSIRKLSKKIQEINNEAFAHAVTSIVECLLHSGGLRGHVVPLRPLVMGGDDITVIARADIALPFIDLFTKRFEELGQFRIEEREVNLSLGVGMVVMGSSYPFAKAFSLVESLIERAKKLTASMAEDARRRGVENFPRPSSLDYLVLTEDVENDAARVRARVYTARDGAVLTSKPLLIGKGVIEETVMPDGRTARRAKDEPLADFVREGMDVLGGLPRSALRQAWTACRKGRNSAARLWLNTMENLERGLGGRKDEKLMPVKSFTTIFPDGFFRERNGRCFTSLGDYLELERILPGDPAIRGAMLQLMLAGGEKDA